METDEYRMCSSGNRCLPGSYQSVDHNERAEEFLVNERGIPAEKIAVVPNCVDTSRFRPGERDKELEDRLRFKGKKVIGYVGSVVDYEGWIFFSPLPVN